MSDKDHSGQNIGGVGYWSPAPEVQERYDGWATEYDRDLQNAGYTLPLLMTKIARRFIPNLDSLLLDAGAGTGLMGQALSEEGYSNIHGIDLSPEMLAAAQAREIYQGLKVGNLTDLPYETNSYDHVLSAGTIGVAPKESLDELIRVVRPNGFIIFSNRTIEHMDGGFQTHQDYLERQKLWEQKFFSGPLAGDTKKKDNPFVVFVYQVTKPYSNGTPLHSVQSSDGE